MFLKVLNKEDRINFMGFIYSVANCDNEYTEEEQEIVNNYLEELELNEVPKSDKTIDELIKYFAIKDESVKKIVLFEIYGIILSDDKISDEEQIIMDKITSNFNIDKEKLSEIKKLVINLKDIYNQVYNVLF